MMTARKTLIARFDFASDGTELDDLAWKQRRDSFLHRLHTQLPALRQLMASTLETTTELTGQRIYLVVYLQETAQTQIRFHSTKTGGQDLYLQDLSRVHKEQAGLPERLQQAIRSTVHPVDSHHIGELRHLLWKSRREGRIQLPSSRSDDWMDIPQLPYTLPGRARTSTVVQILRISRTEIRALLIDDLRCPLSQRHLFNRTSEVNLQRDRQLCDLSTSVVLVTLMHQQTPTQIEVDIEYSWVDGQPHRLTLASMHSQK